MKSEKLQAWALTAEIISGVVVIATLLILILEIRQNTDAVRSATYDSLVADLARMRQDHYLNEHVIEAMHQRNIDPDSMTGVQALISRESVVILFQHWERAFLQHERGNLDDLQWSRFEKGMCAGTVPKRGWDAAKQFIEPVVADEFYAYIAQCYGE